MKILLLAVACGGVVYADDSAKDEITRVKRSDDYLYAEATLDTPREALAMAEVQLDIAVEKYVGEQKRLKGADKIVVIDRQSKVDRIELARGDKYRAFLYVKKSDVIGARSAEVITMRSEESAVVAQAEPNAKQEPELSAAERHLLTAKKFAELKPLITSMKNDGQIADYTLYTRLTDASAYYLVVCNRQQEVVALLAPGGDVRHNLTSGGDSRLSDFWHGATIAVRMK